MKKILLASFLVLSTGCSMFDLPPELVGRLDKLEQRSNQTSLSLDSARSAISGMSADDPQMADVQRSLRLLEAKEAAESQEAAALRAEINNHMAEVANKVAGMAETGVNLVGAPLSMAFPAAAPAIGLIMSIIAGIRRKKNGS
jgi:hypothetical protein